jgi:hypothetical protein
MPITEAEGARWADDGGWLPDDFEAALFALKPQPRTPETRAITVGSGHMIVDGRTADFLESGPTEQQLRGAIAVTEEQLSRGFRWEADPVIAPYLTEQERRDQL